MTPAENVNEEKMDHKEQCEDVVHNTSITVHNNSIKIGTFNCKNIVTAGKAIEDIMKEVDILLVQEHWLFNFQLHMFNEISSSIKGVGKAVDDMNPISPVQKPRGYGGVGVIWKKSLDSNISVLPDGCERIQCIEMKTKGRPLIVISTYLPSKGRNNNIDEFGDCVQQINEIVHKYKDTHFVIIGGDLNEELHKEHITTRAKYIHDLMEDCELEATSNGPTFIHANGRDSSEIDYFLFQCKDKYIIENVQKVDDLCSNVSDHYPIVCELKICTEVVQPKSEEKDVSSFRIKWEMVDKDLYGAAVLQSLPSARMTLDTQLGITTAVNDVHHVLNEAAKISYQKPRKRKSKPKLKVWSNRIRSSLKTSKQAHWRYKNAKRSGNLNQQIIMDRKTAKMKLRSEIRKEVTSREVNKKEQIMEARTSDKPLFYKLRALYGFLSADVDKSYWV